MRPSLFIHTATITKHSHTIASQRKTTARTTPSDVVECRIQPITDATNATIMGLDVVTTYRGFFPPGTDIEEFDNVAWNSITLAVTSVESFTEREDYESHIETILRVTEAVGGAT